MSDNLNINNMEECALCAKELTFTSKPLTGGVLSDGNKICRFCLKKLNNISPNTVFGLKKYNIDDIKRIEAYPIETKTNNKGKINAKGCFVFVIIFAVIGIAFKIGCSSNDTKITYTKEQLDSIYSKKKEIEAVTMAQQFIKDRLKSPASANFPYEDTKIWYSKDSIFTVKGTVDSQNSFGAMMRSYYIAKVKQVDSVNWILLDGNIIQR